MSLVLAVRNKDSIVVAADSDGSVPAPDRFGQFMQMGAKNVLLIAGNLPAVHRTIVEMVMPKISPTTSAAGLAQIVRAALVLDVVPRIAELKGRVEFIVAGIDAVRHTEQPGLYYLDSAQDFYLKIVNAYGLAAGSTAEALPLIEGRQLGDATPAVLTALAKECFTTTKLRWPNTVKSHLHLGVISSSNVLIEQY
jgi:20S proteasome alpha/beta subunit